MHIPKAAGLSFVRDYLKMIPEDVALYSAELCYNQFIHKSEFRRGMGDGVITMLRKPKDQVYSQYLECAQDSWGLKVVPKEQRHLLKNFSTWLQHFTHGGSIEEDDMNCYHPFNMQARAFVCDERLHHMNMSLKHRVLDMDKVWKNFKEAKFVGLLEHYKESMCLLHETLTGGLPAWCDCTKGKWHEVGVEHESHGVQRHDVKQDLSAADARRIHKLTRSDHKLYKAAKKRFLEEVSKTEKKHGVKLMC